VDDLDVLFLQERSLTAEVKQVGSEDDERDSEDDKGHAHEVRMRLERSKGVLPKKLKKRGVEQIKAIGKITDKDEGAKVEEAMEPAVRSKRNKGHEGGRHATEGQIGQDKMAMTIQVEKGAEGEEDKKRGPFPGDDLLPGTEAVIGGHHAEGEQADKVNAGVEIEEAGATEFHESRNHNGRQKRGSGAQGAPAEEEDGEDEIDLPLDRDGPEDVVDFERIARDEILDKDKMGTDIAGRDGQAGVPASAGLGVDEKINEDEGEQESEVVGGKDSPGAPLKEGPKAMGEDKAVFEGGEHETKAGDDDKKADGIMSEGERKEVPTEGGMVTIGNRQPGMMDGNVQGENGAETVEKIVTGEGGVRFRGRQSGPGVIKFGGAHDER